MNLSEDGKYYSAFDGKIHEDGGHSFYTDDWIWDTYRAVSYTHLPMATVILGGLLTSTFLNGFIIPIVYLLMNKEDKE